MTNTPSRSLIELPEAITPTPQFLQPGATTEQLIRAAAENHIAWFGGDFREENGVRWKEGLIAFPEMPDHVASQQLDTIVDFHRQREPREVACWALSPPQPSDLGGRLVARGFKWGWQPHWMALDLSKLSVNFPVPEGLHIAVDNERNWDVDDLPYYTKGESKPKPSEPSEAEHLRWHFGAWLNGKLVGQSALQVTTGHLGIAGIYNVGVVPAARRQGIGRAVSLAACQFAKALGCHYALLNAATHIYNHIGFVSLGFGQTWFLDADALAAPPPTPVQVAYFEAVGQGNIAVLDRLYQDHPQEDLDQSLASGMTLMALAVCMEKPSSAQWLVDHGAILDIIHTWDLGWKERTAALLQESPHLANRQVGKQGATALHEAAARNDVELARLVLTANPDLTLRDWQFNGTPLNWAEVMRRSEIADLIRKQSGSS